MSTISKKLLAVAVACSVSLVASTASADIAAVIPDMGSLEGWALFSLGNNSSGDYIAGSSIDGDVAAAGKGSVRLDSSTIDGNFYYSSGRTLQLSGGATITGSKFGDQNTLLDNAKAAALAVSKAAANLASSQPFADLSLEGGQMQTIAGAPGETVVLNLRRFELNGGSTLTLSGTATTNFIINVKGQFSLLGNSQIVLAGGLDWNNVLINVRGKGPDVRIAGQSNLPAILMANQRTVRVRDQAMVQGEIIANRIMLTGASQIVHPPVTSP